LCKKPINDFDHQHRKVLKVED